MEVTYLSEDYMFPEIRSELGIKTWFCPWMKLGHTGSYVFNGTMGQDLILSHKKSNLDYK